MRAFSAIATGAPVCAMTERPRTSSPTRLKLVIGLIALAIILVNIWGVRSGQVESPLLAIVISAGAAIYALIAMRRINRRAKPDATDAPPDQ